jgi:hypothetical protein
LKGGDHYACQTSSEVPLCESGKQHTDTTLHFALVPALLLINIITYVLYVHPDKKRAVFFQFGNIKKNFLNLKGEHHARLINV